MGCAGEADARVNVIHVTPTGEGDGAQPLAGAQVQVAPNGPTCTTDANGQYILGPLPEGSHRLVVSAAGFDDRQREIQVPITDPAATFDVELQRNQP